MRTEAILENNNVEECHVDREKRIMERVQRIFDPKFRPHDYESFSNEKHIAWVLENLGDVYECLPEETRFLVPALTRPGDCGRPANEKPEWLDMEKFKRGQKFARDNFLATIVSALLGFFAVYSARDGFRMIILTTKSNTPYNSFFRYLRNAENLIISYRSDPWQEGTEAYKEVQTVRRVHNSVRKKYGKLSMEEIEVKTKIKNAWCPMRDVLLDDFRSSCPLLGPVERSHYITENRPFAAPLLNQMDMSMTVFGFMGLIVVYPEYFGLSTDDDEGLDAFCHFWRGMGYLYGIEDEYNFCKGTLEEIRVRARRTIEYTAKPNFREITPEWEHVTRCMVDGLSYYIPLVYEALLIYFSDVVNIQVPRLRASLSLLSWLYLKLMQFYFFYLSKVPGVVPLMNKLMYHTIFRAMNYSKDKIEEIKRNSDELMLSLSVTN